MANITKSQMGEMSRILFNLLWDRPDGLPAKTILAHIPTATNVSKLSQIIFLKVN